MTYRFLDRPLREPGPEVPLEPLAVPLPPVHTRPSQGRMSWLQYALPAVGSLGSVAFIAAARSPLLLIGGLLLCMTGVLIGVGLFIQQRGGLTWRKTFERVRYTEALDDVRREVRATAAAQVAAARWAHPSPAALWQLANSSRLWERRRGDPDFLTVRIGTGAQPLARPVEYAPFNGGLGEVDRVAARAAEELLAGVGAVPDLPLSIDLRVDTIVLLHGEGEATLGAVRALVAQVAAWHGPDDVALALAAPPERRPRWEWMKWLPHLTEGDIEDVRRGTHVVVVVDDDDERPPRRLAGVTYLHVGVGPTRRPARGEVVATVADGAVTLTRGDDSETGHADHLSAAAAEALARRLAPVRLGGGADSDVTAVTADAIAALGVDPDHLDRDEAWRPRTGAAFLRAAIGTDADGAPLVLDLKESAEGGMGPHGLVVGAVGSGKSELLRTLVIALTATHSPEQLNLVLVDFKGGATFADVADLPHVAGNITNLADDAALVDRVRQALDGELDRRQEILGAAGHGSVRDYEAARRRGERLEALPTLVVIVDEFNELLALKPDFIDMFVRIGRVGRSLGIHLLLASQRLEEGRLRGLESYLSYRVGLRTFSAAESRTVLDTPDAYELPPEPGAAILKVDTRVFTRFQTAFVSGPLRAAAPADDEPARPTLAPFTLAAEVDAEVAIDPVETEPEPVVDDTAAPAPTLLDAVVARLRDPARRAHQVWQPPLDVPATLDLLLGGLDTVAERGLAAVGWSEQARLRTPIGVVDRPRLQRRDLLTVDLSGGQGHIAVVGGPRSGKTTVLRTIVASLALTHTPDELWFYGLDFGGGGLAALAAFPHVGTIAGRGDRELVTRTVHEVAALAAQPGGGTHVVLLIDGWAAFKREHDELEPIVADIAERGLGSGLHVFVAASRWYDMRPQVKDAFGTRLELRITDPIESDIDRREAANVPVERPGRGLTAGPEHFLLALPRGDGIPIADGLDDAIAELGARSRAAWHGHPAPPVRVLPPVVTLAELNDVDAHDTSSTGIPVGRAEDGSVARVDLTGIDSHLLAFGDRQAGKTNLLRTLLTGLVARTPPAEGRLVLIDYKGDLDGAVPDSHLLEHVRTPSDAERVIGEVVESMRRRLPGGEHADEPLRRPAAWVVVDDYDLVATAVPNPVHQVLELLPHGRAIGFHLVLTRAASGAAQSLYDPVIAHLRAMGAPGFLLSGDRAEGTLIGGHRAEQQPPGRALYVTRNGPPRLVQLALGRELDAP